MRPPSGQIRACFSFSHAGLQVRYGRGPGGGKYEKDEKDKNGCWGGSTPLFFSLPLLCKFLVFPLFLLSGFLVFLFSGFPVLLFSRFIVFQFSSFPVFQFLNFPVFLFSSFPLFPFSRFPVILFSCFPVFLFSCLSGLLTS